MVVLGALTRAELLPYFRAIRAKSHTHLPKVQVMKAQTVQISARRPLGVHVDDRVRRRTPVAVRVVPGALRVMVDRL